MKGWKLVPLEPTAEMLVSGQEAWLHKHRARPAMEDCEEAGELYRAMLVVAPEAPELPVAWQYRARNDSVWISCTKKPDEAAKHLAFEVRPLYTRPSAALEAPAHMEKQEEAV